MMEPLNISITDAYSFHVQLHNSQHQKQQNIPSIAQNMNLINSQHLLNTVPAIQQSYISQHLTALHKPNESLLHSHSPSSWLQHQHLNSSSNNTKFDGDLITISPNQARYSNDIFNDQIINQSLYRHAGQPPLFSTAIPLIPNQVQYEILQNLIQNRQMMQFHQQQQKQQQYQSSSITNWLMPKHQTMLEQQHQQQEEEIQSDKRLPERDDEVLENSTTPSFQEAKKPKRIIYKTKGGKTQIRVNVLRTACERCTQRKCKCIRTEGDKCKGCQENNSNCVFTLQRKRGRPNSVDKVYVSPSSPSKKLYTPSILYPTSNAATIHQ